jgi:hypothetical protein
MIVHKLISELRFIRIGNGEAHLHAIYVEPEVDASGAVCGFRACSSWEPIVTASFDSPASFSEHCSLTDLRTVAGLLTPHKHPSPRSRKMSGQDEVENDIGCGCRWLMDKHGMPEGKEIEICQYHLEIATAAKRVEELEAQLAALKTVGKKAKVLLGCFQAQCELLGLRASLLTDIKDCKEKLEAATTTNGEGER